MKLQHLVIEKIGSFLDFQPTEELLEDGILMIDDLSIQVSQIQHAEGVFIGLSAAIVPLDQSSLQSILTLTMSANHFWRGTAGATFSFDPISEQLFLSCKMSQQEVEKSRAEDLGAALIHLFETAKHWQAVIAQLDFESEHVPLQGQVAHALSFGKAAASLQ